MSGLFQTPKIPKAPKPVPMPDPEDQQALAARRSQMELMRRRGGRDSTILSGEASGGDYSKKTLG